MMFLAGWLLHDLPRRGVGVGVGGDAGADVIREYQAALLQLGSNFDQEIAQCKAAAQRFYGDLGQHPRPRDGERSNAIASTAAIKIKADDGSGTWPITATAGVELISIEPGRLPRFPIWFISLVPDPFPTLEIDGAASSPPTMPTGNPGPPMNGTGAPLSSSGPSPGPPYGRDSRIFQAPATTTASPQAICAGERFSARRGSAAPALCESRAPSVGGVEQPVEMLLVMGVRG